MQSHISVKGRNNYGNQSSFELVAENKSYRRPRIFDRETENILPKDLLEDQQFSNVNNNNPMFDLFRDSFKPIKKGSDERTYNQSIKQPYQKEQYYDANPNDRYLVTMPEIPKNQKPHYIGSNKNVDSFQRSSAVTDQTEKMEWNKESGRSGNPRQTMEPFHYPSNAKGSSIATSRTNTGKFANFNTAVNADQKYLHSGKVSKKNRQLTQQQMLEQEIQKEREQEYRRKKTVFINEGGIVYDKNYIKSVQQEAKNEEREQLKQFRSYDSIPSSISPEKALQRQFRSRNGKAEHSSYDSFNQNSSNFYRMDRQPNQEHTKEEYQSPNQSGTVRDELSLNNQVQDIGRMLPNRWKRDEISESHDITEQQEEVMPLRSYSKIPNSLTQINSAQLLSRFKDESPKMKPTFKMTDSVMGTYFGDQPGQHPQDSQRVSKKPLRGTKLDSLLMSSMHQNGISKFSEKPIKKAPFEINSYNEPRDSTLSGEKPVGKAQQFEKPIQVGNFPIKSKIEEKSNPNSILDAESLIDQVGDEALENEEVKYWAENMMKTINKEKQQEGKPQITDKDFEIIHKAAESLVPGLKRKNSQNSSIRGIDANQQQVRHSAPSHQSLHKAKTMYPEQSVVRVRLDETRRPNAKYNQNDPKQTLPLPPSEDAHQRMLKSETNRITFDPNHDYHRALFDIDRHRSHYEYQQSGNEADCFQRGSQRATYNEGLDRKKQQQKRNSKTKHEGRDSVDVSEKCHYVSAKDKQLTSSSRNSLEGRLSKHMDIVRDQFVGANIYVKDGSDKMIKSTNTLPVENQHRAHETRFKKTNSSIEKITTHKNQEHQNNKITKAQGIPRSKLSRIQDNEEGQNANTDYMEDDRSSQPPTPQTKKGSQVPGQKNRIVDKFKLINMTLYLNLVRFFDYMPMDGVVSSERRLRRGLEEELSALTEEEFNYNPYDKTMGLGKGHIPKKHLTKPEYFYHQTETYQPYPDPIVFPPLPEVEKEQLPELYSQLSKLSEQITSELPLIHQHIILNQEQIKNLQLQLLAQKQESPSCSRDHRKALLKMQLQEQELYAKEHQIHLQKEDIGKYQNYLLEMQRKARLQQQETKLIKKELYYENRFDQIKRENEGLCMRIIRRKKEENLQREKIHKRINQIKKDYYTKKIRRLRDEENHHSQENFEELDRSMSITGEEADQVASLQQECLAHPGLGHPLDQLEEIDRNLEVLREFRRHKKGKKQMQIRHHPELIQRVF